MADLDRAATCPTTEMVANPSSNTLFEKRKSGPYIFPLYLRCESPPDIQQS